MGWLIALAVLVLLSILPLGASVRYDSDGVCVRVIAGPVKITLFPRPKKRNISRKEKQKEEQPKKKSNVAQKQESSVQTEKPDGKVQEKQKTGGSWTDFLPLVKVGLDLLNSFRRKLRVNVLELKLILAGDDPCDQAVNYGRVWAAASNLMPQLERLFVIKKRDIQVECDFTAEEISVIAHVDITITLGRLLTMAVVYGIRVLFEFLSMKRKGGGDQ